MKIFIDLEEVLRYLGHKGQMVDDITDSLIKECIDEISQNFNGKYIYKIFDISKDKGYIEVLGSELKLVGCDILNHLKDCNKCAIMAATMGVDVDNKIRYYEKSHLAKSIIFDACATAAIESLCDQVEKEIGELAGKEKLGVTWRFSPGYGDLPIEIQGEVLNVLDAYRKIGLGATENYILIPRKSVTAIIGFKEGNDTKEFHKCKKCNMDKNCNYKRGGKGCEH